MDARSGRVAVTLFLSTHQLAQRKRDLRGDPSALGGLAGSLQVELHAALDVPIPEGKARLTRNGGRCAKCTVFLDFDPRQPHNHECPSCGAVYSDRVHHEWWLMNAHLWTAEQGTRAAALAFLCDDHLAARRADEILVAYSARYLLWPNRDNALGPTRPFFSTYLESIWLLHLATALDLRIAATGGAIAMHSEVLDRLIAPSAALIAGFDEGRSNRQVWHAAGLLAAARLLQDAGMRDRAASSLQNLIRTGLHSDGSWYEGENYHLFAHRGLLSGVTLAERAGVELPPSLLARFELGFAAPFRTMLPDGTFPARRDSQYAIALRQYRTADWAECGFARTDTPELRAALASLYASWPEAGDSGRWNSTADAERNRPSVRLSRSDCSWRALLLARLELPALTDATPRSELLQGQGLAVLRRQEGQIWIGLDYGDPGDGHGHPDRLNLVVATPATRLLDDVGTGSYTSPTLAWYRSTLAHNAPMVNGQDQGEAHGSLLAYDERGAMGWVSAEFVDPRTQVHFVRNVVALEDHLVDEIVWTSAADVTIDLPMQARMTQSLADDWSAFAPGTDQDAALDSPEASMLGAGVTRHLVLDALPSPAARRAAPDAPRTFDCFVWSDTPATLWRAGTIGPPAGAPHGLVALRQRGQSGRSLRVMFWHAAAPRVSVDGARVTVHPTADAGWSTVAEVVHERASDGWRVTRDGGRTRDVIVLGGLIPREPVSDARPTPPTPAVTRLLKAPGFALTVPLGEADYRRTEESWQEAGRPVAVVRVSRETHGAAALALLASVTLRRVPAFAARMEVNPLDNELPDVNSDGVQLHWRAPRTGTWNSIIAVPDGPEVRITVCAGELDGLSASWQRTEDGFDVHFRLPWPPEWPPLEFDLIVNERPAGRERRRGQLVLSGARGEFAYLRGARQSPERALHVAFDPVDQ